jgi:type I restriction enzyme S subunit
VVPPREEQDRIVAFLDQKTAEVDAAIAKKERLIGLLHEQMDIVINQLVRVGLNPAASLKDSGTPWLGPIPSHWRPSRLKFLFSGMEQGWSPQCFNNFEAPEGTWGVLKVGCVNGAVFNERENKQLPPSERPIPGLQVRVGDILISRANSLELVGSAAFVNQCKGKLLLCDKLYRVHAHEDQVLSEYLVLMLRTKTARQWIENGANGASPSMQNIGQDVIKNLLVAVPPLDEQRQILAQVESAREKIGLLENRTRSEIGAMAEMRRILISDAVVGKIKI